MALHNFLSLVTFCSFFLALLMHPSVPSSIHTFSSERWFSAPLLSSIDPVTIRFPKTYFKAVSFLLWIEIFLLRCFLSFPRCIIVTSMELFAFQFHPLFSSSLVRLINIHCNIWGLISHNNLELFALFLTKFYWILCYSKSCSDFHVVFSIHC